GGTITAGTLTGSSGGDASLAQPGNRIAGLGAFTTTTGEANGNFVLFNAVALTQGAETTVYTGSGTILIDNGGKAFTQNGTLRSTSSATPAVTVENTGALSVGTIDAPGGVALGKQGLPVGAVSETGTIDPTS